MEKGTYYGQRLERLAARIDEVGADSFVTLAAPHIRYLTGFTGEEAFLLAIGGGVHLVVDGRFTTQAREECPWLDVIEYTGNCTRVMAPLVAQGHAHWTAFEKGRVSYLQLESMRSAFASAVMVPSENLVEGMRMVKDETELTLLRKAGHVADQAFRAAVPQVRSGVTENDVAATLEFEMRKAGAQGTSFATIVGSGPRGALPHGVASDRVLQTGDVVVIDFGVNYQGYMSDCTRTVALGVQPDDVMATYEHLLAAQALGLQSVMPGAGCRAVDSAVRALLGENDLAQYFTHGLGHGVGLEIHEAPRLSQSSDAVLEAGQVVTVEPGVYLPGRYGMRIEDSVIVTVDGCEPLTDLPKEFVIA
jgi:Xaa-Pro aminopeptidase